MFKIEIKNLENILTNSAEFLNNQQCLDWLNEVKVSGAFGKLEREVREISEGILDNNEDIAKSVSVREEEMLGGQIVRFHTLPQEFTHTITDVTAQKLAQQESQEALAYLASTDWVVVRKAETNVDFPQEVKDLRAAARLKVI